MATTVKPLRDANAIEAAHFLVSLQQVPNGAVERVRNALDKFEDDLPGTQIQQVMTPGVMFSFNGMAPPMFGEVVRFHALPDGQHDWRVQMTANLLQITCHQYTNFSDVWGKAQRFLVAMIEAIDESVQIAEVSHQVQDRFDYEISPDIAAFDMSSLFRQDSPFLTRQSWNSGLEWHVFQGWFEDNGSPQRILNQLNVSNLMTDASKYGCVIDHRTVLQPRLDSPLTCGDLLKQGEDGKNRIDSVMSKLHKQNTSAMRRLLNSSILDKIGLGEQ